MSRVHANPAQAQIAQPPVHQAPVPWQTINPCLPVATEARTPATLVAEIDDFGHSYTVVWPVLTL